MNLYNVDVYTPINDSKELRGLPFKIQDTHGLIKELGYNNYLIINIDPYNNQNKPLSSDELNNALTAIKKLDPKNIAILASSYVSTKEFPEDKYYCTACDKVSEEEKIGKQDIPFDDIIQRQNKILTEAGFVNCNKYYSLEFSEGFIYPETELGKKLIERIKELQ